MATKRTSTLAMSGAALAAVGLLAAGCGDGTDAAPDSSAPPGISTQGTGKVSGTPDTLTVMLGVQTQARDAAGALAENAEKANALIDTLKGKGVRAEDIQTSGLSVQPTYDPNSSTITGYQVTNQVTATVHDVGAAGGLIDAAAAAAGDAVRVQQTSFSIADDSDLREQARADAVRQAQAQASQIAEAAGVELGKVRSITEVPAAGPTPYPYPGAALDRAPTPIEPGGQELTVTVAVVYDID
ncbi:SIMPL domain-containing protein [Rhodococcus sp. NPDC058514]|uniref:SIMPL domain-containing protein n=1 Tax=unclassified Rhodococcus (in: high G+C Gram-positive bacteria) TaxID=192944 RepID=UPI0036677F99